MSLPVALGVLLLCFVVLLKCASWFVDGAVGIAEHLRVPKVLVGIVLVSVATTAPELFVSVQSHFRDTRKLRSEMRLGPSSQMMVSRSVWGLSRPRDRF